MLGDYISILTKQGFQYFSDFYLDGLEGRNGTYLSWAVVSGLKLGRLVYGLFRVRRREQSANRSIRLLVTVSPYSLREIKSEPVGTRILP